MTMKSKPRLAVIKFASCDGCQLTLLDAEDELLKFASAVHIAHFAEASSHLEDGPYDITLVEGSITTPHDIERLKRLAAASKQTGDNRCLRDGWGRAGAAQFFGSCRVHAQCLRSSRMDRNSGDFDSHRRSCARRL